MVEFQIVGENKLAEQILKLENAEAVIGAEFQVAGKQTVDYLTKDLRRGVGKVTGDLQGSIVGAFNPMLGGIESENQITAGAEHGGYAYGARLDKDGSMRWRSGKFRSYRTFGWFTKVLERNAPKNARRYYQKALDRAVLKLVVK